MIARPEGQGINQLFRLQAQHGAGEQVRRLAVLHGLWPLLDVLVRGEPGALRCKAEDGDALVALGLAVDDGTGGLAGTELAVEVLHLLAVLLVLLGNAQLGDRGAELGELVGVALLGDVPPPWPHLLEGGRPNARGSELALWLALGVPGEADCYITVCDHVVDGIAVRPLPKSQRVSLGGVRQDTEVLLACRSHRRHPRTWASGPLDLRLVGVPEVDHG